MWRNFLLRFYIFSVCKHGESTSVWDCVTPWRYILVDVELASGSSRSREKYINNGWTLDHSPLLSTYYMPLAILSSGNRV